jgi:hypothetical protein
MQGKVYKFTEIDVKEEKIMCRINIVIMQKYDKIYPIKNKGEIEITPKKAMKGTRQRKELEYREPGSAENRQRVFL